MVKQNEIRKNLIKEVQTKNHKLESLEKDKKELEEEKSRLLGEAIKYQEKIKDLEARKMQSVRYASISKTSSVEIYRGLVSKYFPAEEVENALKIMSCGIVTGKQSYS